MNNHKEKQYRIGVSPLTLALIVLGMLLNVFLSKIVGANDLPIYLDTIGTVVVAALGGIIPGILTALLTNLINFTSDGLSIYYAGLNVLIAVVSAQFFIYKRMNKAVNVVTFILCLSLIGGGLGGVITWVLYGPSETQFMTGLMSWFSGSLRMSAFWSHLTAVFLMDIVDKTITVLTALLIFWAVPQNIKETVRLEGWRQRPLNKEEMVKADAKIEGGISLSARIMFLLVFATLSMAVVVSWFSLRIFSEFSREQHTKLAQGVANLVANEIDPDMVDTFLELGEDAPGYSDAEMWLTRIRDSSPDIEYVYAYKIEEDGCHVVFDLDTEELEGEKPGTVIPFDESFMPYIDDLLAGRPIEPIESNDTYGWLFTVYQPVYNDEGECVCYAAADIAVQDLMDYEESFILRVVLLFMGFFILIVVVGLWLARYHIIMPVRAMTQCANEFAFNDDLDGDGTSDSVERIMGLDIQTNDEVESLYKSFCKMADDTVRQMNDIREQANTINKLQDGLILIMADMVESRDSDTGYHIKKTAAYTQIIMDGLKRLGYYTDQLTDTFVQNVVRSAPLHDIGKINVSDIILNKPGKLTDEEFRIMQTHTTAGRDLIDQAIQQVQGESYLSEARNLAGYHHEKWNGRGYPEGLSGEDIPLSARIMAVADVFDALTSKRVYKPAMSFEKAVAIIKEDSGTHFDPKCAEAFLDSLDEVKAVLDKYTAYEEEDERNGITRNKFVNIT